MKYTDLSIRITNHSLIQVCFTLILNNFPKLKFVFIVCYRYDTKKSIVNLNPLHFKNYIVERNR